MPTWIWCLRLILLGTFGLAGVALAQSVPRAGDRARVSIASVPDTIGGGLPLKVLRTDTNTPLRAGAVWLFKETAANAASNAPAKDPSFYRKMRDARLNAVRLVLFEFWFQCDDVTKTSRYSDLDNPTERAALLANIETVVNLASEQGLYVILNPHTKANHGGTVYGQAQHDYVRKFWSYAAPYFKDRTNVIYEQANEVILLPTDTTDAGLDRQQQLYTELRAWAPQTHIALISMSGIWASTGGIDVAKTIADRLSARGTGIDWSNASFCYHLYFNGHTSERMRQLHKYYPAFPGENNYPYDGAALTGVSVSDTARSESMDVPSTDRTRYVNQTCEQLGTGWALWQIETPYKFDNNWPLARADAQARGYYWNADPILDRYFEAEDLTPTATSAGDTHAIFSAAGLSGAKGRQFNANAPADFITVKLSSVSPGAYNVKLRLVRGPDGGTVQAAIDPGSGVFADLGSPVDGYAAVSDMVVVDLGSVSFPTAGDKLLRLTLSGKNPAASGYAVRLDYALLRLDPSAPVPRPIATLAPSAISATVARGATATASFGIANTGDAALHYTLQPVFTDYTARDSAQSGSPAFSWVDVKTGGTSILANTDDAIVTGLPLGFAFPFYGASYSTVNVCSNGFLSFLGNTVISSTTGETLPTGFTGNPAPLIAPYLLDLVVDASAGVYYRQVDANTFGVLFENVRPYLATGRITFEVLLKSDGRIIFQFKDNTITFRGALIGFQDATRTKGQTLVFNEDYLPQGSGINRALTVFPPASWLSRSPASGTVAVGAPAQSITLGFDATSLPLGDYDANLLLNSDDPDLGSAVIPVTLHVVPPGTGPLWASGWPRVTAPSSTGFILGVRVTSAANAYYVVVPAGSPAPSAAQVKLGQNAAGASALQAGSLILAADVESSVNVSGLASSTGYDVYVVAGDALGNLQSAPTVVSIATVAPRTLAWDADGAGASGAASAALGVGGTGGWDVATPRWWDGSAYVVQAPDSPDQSYLRGAGGTVSLGTNAATRSLTFNQAATTWTLTGGALRFEALAAFENRLALASAQNAVDVTLATPAVIDENALTGTIESVFSTGNASGQTLTLAGGLARAAGAVRDHRVLVSPNTAASGTPNRIALTGAINNGGSATGRVFAEFGARTPAASAGRLELRATNAYTGDTRVGAGVIVAYGDAPVSGPGVFGNAAGVITLGYGQVAATASIYLLTNGPVTIARPLFLENGASANGAYVVTLGGESADASAFTGAIDLDGSTARTNPLTLTAAPGGVVAFSGVISHNAAGSSVPVNITGGGVVRLDAANLYTGLTTVTGGGALGGVGSVAGALTVAAGGGLAFAVGSAPAVHDRFDVGGILTFAGASTVTISAGLNATPGTYVLLRAAGGISGPLPSLVLPAGWTATLAVSGNDLQLVVVATTAIDSWRFAHFGTIANAGSAADSADADGDGAPNLLEYAFGTTPTSAASVALPTTQLSGNRLRLSFTRTRADVNCVVESSPDLATWTTVPYAPAAIGQTQTVTDTVDLPTSNPGRRFLRLRVSNP